METNAARGLSGFKMAVDGVLCLLLQLAQISALCGDAATFGGIPTRYQPP